MKGSEESGGRGEYLIEVEGGGSGGREGCGVEGGVEERVEEVREGGTVGRDEGGDDEGGCAEDRE